MVDEFSIITNKENSVSVLAKLESADETISKRDIFFSFAFLNQK